MSEGFTVSARQTGRPAALTGDRERECYELLERLGIAYEWVEFSRQPETTAEAEEVDKALGVPGLKNLIFQNRNRSRTLVPAAAPGKASGCQGPGKEPEHHPAFDGERGSAGRICCTPMPERWAPWN